MTRPPLFRPEVVRKAAKRLDGAVVISLPSPVWLSGLLLCAVLAAAVIFASTATYSRKEVARGWVTWSSGVANVRAPANAVLKSFGVKEGDWVSEGQPLIWADSSRLNSGGGSDGSGIMIYAPISGQVILAEVQDGLVAEPNRVLFVIAPDGGRLQARLLIPSRAIGFLKTGQEVRLALDAYPFQRFGLARARITRISGSAVLPGQSETPLFFQEASYLVDAELETRELSAYGQPARLENGMQFTADIIIDRRNLFEWLFDPLYASGKSGLDL